MPITWIQELVFSLQMDSKAIVSPEKNSKERKPRAQVRHNGHTCGTVSEGSTISVFPLGSSGQVP